MVALVERVGLAAAVAAVQTPQILWRFGVSALGFTDQKLYSRLVIRVPEVALVELPHHRTQPRKEVEAQD